MKAASRRTFTFGGAASAALLVNSRPLAAAPFTWKWSFDEGPEHPIAVRMVAAFDAIRSESKGQLDIKAFTHSSLGSAASALVQLREGAVEMAMEPGAVFASIVPSAAVENLAYAFPNSKAVFEAFDGDLGASIRQESLQKGLILLDRIFENGWRDFACGKGPIRSVVDLDGLRLRVSPGKIRFDTFHSLGASVVTLDGAAVYTALQTHIVDAMESGIGDIKSLRIAEVVKYLSRSHHMWSGYWVMVNLEKWNALGNQLQEVVRKHVDSAAVLERQDIEGQDTAIQDLLHRQGMEVNFPSYGTFKAKLKSAGYYERWKSEFGDRIWALLEKYVGPLG